MSRCVPNTWNPMIPGLTGTMKTMARIGTSRLMAAAIAPMSAPALRVLATTRAITAG
jgi:hypothetical protein